MKIMPEPQFEHAIHVTLNLTWVCNYDCSYCYNKGKDISVKDYTPYEYILDFLQSVNRKYPHKTIYLYISGGEPTIYKDFDKLVKGIKETTNSKIALVNNATQSLEWWGKNSKYFDSINLSYHTEFVDKEHYYNVCKTILENNKTSSVSALIMMNEPYFDEAYEFAQKLLKLEDVIVNIKKIRQHTYTKEHADYMVKNNMFVSQAYKSCNSPRKKNKTFEIKYILQEKDGVVSKIHINECILKDENVWTGWHCNAGIESFCVDPNGDVFRANCRVDGVIGNVRDGVNIDLDPVVCSRPECMCRTEIYVNKWK